MFETLKKLFDSKRTSAKTRRQSFKPQVEMLEVREVPAALAYVNYAAAGAGIDLSPYADIPSIGLVTPTEAGAQLPSAYEPVSNYDIDVNSDAAYHVPDDIDNDTVRLVDEYNNIGVLPGLPILNSNLGAEIALYLNFTGSRMNADFDFDPGDGQPRGNLRGFSAVFDLDGDTSSFNEAEQLAITRIWKYVADDFAPFNVNVTTLSNLPDINSFGYSSSGYQGGHTFEVAIGGESPKKNENGSFVWGTTADEGAFYKDEHANTAFVFSETIRAGILWSDRDAFVEYVSSTAAHEAGHGFGLYHQSDYDGEQLISEYSRGTDNWAPIMGFATPKRATWHTGPILVRGGEFDGGDSKQDQDDLHVLATGVSMLGYRPDDVPSANYRTMHEIASGEFFQSGFIGIEDASTGGRDEDWFVFTTNGGPVDVRLYAAGPMGNVLALLELTAMDETVLASSDHNTNVVSTAGLPYGPEGWLENIEAARYQPTNRVTHAWLPAGSYLVRVAALEGYGNMGTYDLQVSANGGGQLQAPSSPIGNLAGLFAATDPSARAVLLQARLAELDQAVAQNQQALQGALDVQVQTAAESERIAGEIQSATEADATNPWLADLQASQIQVITALVATQQQIEELQSQLALLTSEQSLIGSVLEETTQSNAAGEQTADLQYAVDELNQSLAQVRQELQVAEDAQARTATEVQSLTEQVQAASDALTAAELSLSNKAVNLELAAGRFNVARRSTQAFQVQVDLKAAAQSKLDRADAAYQDVLKAQKANRDSSQRSLLKQQVSLAKAVFNSAAKELKLLNKSFLAAQKAMNRDATALQKASAALELARTEYAAASQAFQQAELRLADLQFARAEAIGADQAAQDLVVQIQNRVDQLPQR